MLPAHLEHQLSDFDPQELGPHAAALLAEMRRAVRAGMPLTVLLLAATLVDVVANEEAGRPAMSMVWISPMPATRRRWDGFVAGATSCCITKGRQMG